MTPDHPVPYCLIESTCLPPVYSMYSSSLFLFICPVLPLIGEHVAQSISCLWLPNMFPFSFLVTICSRPIALLIQYLLVIQLSPVWNQLSLYSCSCLSLSLSPPDKNLCKGSTLVDLSYWIQLVTNSGWTNLLSSLCPPPLSILLVLVISTSSYDSITYYHGLLYLLPTCFSFIAAL